MAPRVPKIGLAVKVVTKKKPKKYGTVVASVGQHKWSVEFKDENGVVSTEVLSSQQLGIYKEYYNKPSNTPVKDALKTIRKAVRQTVSRHRGSQIQSRNSGSSSSSDNQQSNDEDLQLDADNKIASPAKTEENKLNSSTDP
jgi:hypothetical protein